MLEFMIFSGAAYCFMCLLYVLFGNKSVGRRAHVSRKGW